MAEGTDAAHWESLGGKDRHVEEEGRRLTGERFATMCRTAAVLGVVGALATLVTGDFLVGCLLGASLCGIAEAHGRCGMSHIGMTAPFASNHPRMWLKCVSAYTVAGLCTSYLVGLALAAPGTLAAAFVPSTWSYALAGVVALAMLLRELNVVRFNPPQCDIQTHKRWAREFGLVTGAGMWGAHIGLALTTVITHGGVYALVLIAFAGGLGNGEWIMVAFWIGRVLPLWLTPWLSRGSTDGVAIFGALREAEPSFYAIAASGLAILFVLCVATFSPTVVSMFG